MRVNGRIARTNKTSQTAFRGFGGPQGMLVIEDILGRCAPLLGIDPAELRRRNFYVDGQATPYGQPVRHAERLVHAWDDLTARADLARRRDEVAAFNATHPHAKRGLAITPVKFGISFNFTTFNQAGALVHVYTDGSVLINHGGTEMGQGLHTKMLQVAADEPRAPAVAGPARAHAHRQGAQHLCDCGELGRRPQRRRRQARLRADHRPSRRGGSSAPRRRAVVRHHHRRRGARRQRRGPDVGGARRPRLRPARAAVGGRLLPHRGLHWDSTAMQGSPFKYFAYGVAAAEVEVDGFTGAYRTRRVDIVHDVGDSLSPLVDIGQIEGGFVQGAGWLTLEDLRWDESDGPTAAASRRSRRAPTSCPSMSEMPEVFNVSLLEHAHEDGAVYGSKAVGEPPLMLAFSVREALRQAAAAFGPDRAAVHLAIPATPEAVWWAIESARSQSSDDPDARRAEHAGVDRGQPRDPRRRTGPARARRASPRRRSRSASPSQGWHRELAQRRSDPPRAAPTRCPRHDHRGARPRAPRRRRQDGRRVRRELGHDRRGQPRGDRPRARPGHARC